MKYFSSLRYYKERRRNYGAEEPNVQFDLLSKFDVKIDVSSLMFFVIKLLDV